MCCVLLSPIVQIRLFTLGLQINPRHVLLQFSMGNAFAMLGRKEEAARSFEATLRIQPDFSAADQYLRNLRRELQQQWCPSSTILTISIAFIISLAIIQRTVQFYAMKGGAGAKGAKDKLRRPGPASLVFNGRKKVPDVGLAANGVTRRFRRPRH